MSMKIEKKENEIEIKLENNKVLDHFKEDKIISWIVFDYVFKKIDKLKLSDDELFSIGSLQNKIKETVFDSKISKEIIGNELNNIHVGLINYFEKMTNDPKENNFKLPLYKILKVGYEEVNKQSFEEMIKSDNQLKRNFIAHAGLLKELVIVNIKDINNTNKNTEDLNNLVNKAKLYYNTDDSSVIAILNKIIDGKKNLF